MIIYLTYKRTTHVDRRTVSSYSVPNVKSRTLSPRPPRKSYQRDAQMGLVTARHPPVQRLVHEPFGMNVVMQLTNAEEVVNGESKG